MDISQYLNEQCGLNEHRGQIDSNDGFKEEGLGVVERKESSSVNLWRKKERQCKKEIGNKMLSERMLMETLKWFVA